MSRGEERRRKFEAWEREIKVCNKCLYMMCVSKRVKAIMCEEKDTLQKGMYVYIYVKEWEPQGTWRSAERERNEKECNKLAVRLFSTCIKTSSSDGRLGKYWPTPSAAFAVLHLNIIPSSSFYTLSYFFLLFHFSLFFLSTCGLIPFTCSCLVFVSRNYVKILQSMCNNYIVRQYIACSYIKNTLGLTQSVEVWTSSFSFCYFSKSFRKGIYKYIAHIILCFITGYFIIVY